MAPLLSVGALAALASIASGAVVGTPATGKVWFGAWLDTAEVVPKAWNAEMGFNASSFQFAQDLPVTPYDYTTGVGGMMNQTLIENTGTNASIFLTVYPQTILSLTNITDVQLLAEQILFYQSAPYNRRVLLRYAPEMQGNWMLYGQSPTAFVAGWKTMYATVKSIAPETEIVWSPNTALGYPYGTPDLSSFSAADQALLDTNGDGTLDINDDAYSPYYPGDAYVDWAGISLYEKGAYPYITNSAMASGTIQANLDGDSDSVDVYTPFYSTYCATPARSCVISEAGAAFKTNTTQGTGIGQDALEENWWQQGWTNASFFAAYPQLKMIQLFEFEKTESSDGYNILNDYRITYDPTLRAGFLADIASSVPDLYEYSNYQVIYTGSDGTSQPSNAPTEPQGYIAPTTSAAVAAMTATSSAAGGGSTTTAPATAESATASANLFSGAGRNGGDPLAWVPGMMLTVALAAAGAAGLML